MRNLTSVLVTGGAGFIGSAVVRALLAGTDARVTVVDKLTYAGHEASLAEVRGDPRLDFHRLDICDRAALDRVIAAAGPDSILHLAAESHVDRAIDGPAAFMETNIIGTYTLLEAALGHWRGLAADAAADFRFHHVSTDEVFGSLGADGKFAETTPYDPSSPYSASKAASDHLARAWGRTYGLPVLVTNCSNNYGPRQYPEKFIPLLIEKARRGEPLPVYGDGGNVRDWLYVDDHADALLAVLRRGRPGETYNIGGDCERRNIDVARALCAVLDELAPGPAPHGELITFVTDRPGHDRRYAIDAGKVRRELGWAPRETFETGLRKTVAWYLDNGDWVAAVGGGDAVARRGLGTEKG